MAAGPGTTFVLSQNLTGSAPTLATDGMPLVDLTAVAVVVETANPATQTLSGAGTLLCYVYDDFPALSKWSRLPELDYAVTTSGVARVMYQAALTSARRNGRVIWVPSGVTVSAGTTVTIYQLGYSDRVVY